MHVHIHPFRLLSSYFFRKGQCQCGASLFNIYIESVIIGSSVVEKYDGRYVRLIQVCHSQDDTLFGIAVMLHFETDVHNVSENRMPVPENCV